MNDALEGVCLRWTTAECKENETEVDRLEGESNYTAARKGFEYFFLRVLRALWTLRGRILFSIRVLQSCIGAVIASTFLGSFESLG